MKDQHTPTDLLLTLFSQHSNQLYLGGYWLMHSLKNPSLSYLYISSIFSRHYCPYIIQTLSYTSHQLSLKNFVYPYYILHIPGIFNRGVTSGGVTGCYASPHAVLVTPAKVSRLSPLNKLWDNEAILIAIHHLLIVSHGKNVAEKCIECKKVNLCIKFLFFIH